MHIRSWQDAYRGQLPDTLLDALPSRLDSWAASWRQRITGPQDEGSTVIVVEVDGEIAGFASCGPSRDVAGLGEVYAIYLDPRAWGRGHGRALFASAADALRRRGFAEAMLWVLETNARARRFYERAGWSADGATKTDQRGEVALHEVRYRGRLAEDSP